MTGRPVRLRSAASDDIAEAIDAYAGAGGEALAIRFVDALERCLRRIADHPDAGSPRYGQELRLPGLRSTRLRGFPYLVFHVDAGAAVEVWRVLHAARHIPLRLRDPDDRA